MMEGNFGIQSNNDNNQPPYFKPDEIEKAGNLTVNEIIGRLADTKGKYEEELGKLEAGDAFDEMWLATYHGALYNWKNDIVAMPGILTIKNEEVLDEIEKRLYLISEELEKTIH